jgi:hypothetical protein
MGTVPQASRPLRENPRSIRQAKSNRQPRFLLWYWALSYPRDARKLRVAFVQPVLGVLGMLAGVIIGVQGFISGSGAIEVGGLGVLLLGAIMVLASYLISVAYFKEYPGGFSPQLEEYVARRVSRLSREEFIPRYKPNNRVDARKSQLMNRQVRVALNAEVLRASQPDRMDSASVCGVFVVGPKHSNKTGALWDAMMQHLSGWTFVRWPHHMDYPANLALHLGHRIVLWLDDLHDFANLGEAAALDQFIQQLRISGRRFVVLSSCRAGQDLDEAKRYFRPLINELKQVRVTDSLASTAQRRELQPTFNALSASRQSVLETIDWLESLNVHTFPWEVLSVLSNGFLGPGVDRESAEATLQGLAGHRDRFVRVNRRADPQATLSSERYNVGDWFRYTFVPRKYSYASKGGTVDDIHYVIEPINVNYLDLVNSRAVRTKQTLERQPAHMIQQLEDSPFAAETLILLGNAYLNHLGTNIDNAGELAVSCYDGALNKLEQGNYSNHFPGAWAAAHIGKGIAELRAHKLTEATADFGAVTKRNKLSADDEPTADEVAAIGKLPEANKPTPRLLAAYAWHGKGDAIAAEIPSSMSLRISGGELAPELKNAAVYFKRAANRFPSPDPLYAETRLDRANVLYVIAWVAAGRFTRSLADIPVQPPIAEIDATREAYLDVQDSYSESAAPAVWAEIQRRLGQLCLMRTGWLLPAHVQLPNHFSAAGIADLKLFADETSALEMAKRARAYFSAACNVFAPSYMPTSWFNAQVGLVRAQLIVARLTAQADPEKAKDIYDLCLTITMNCVTQIATPAHSALDWADIQLFRAQIEMGKASLEPGVSQALYKDAGDIVANVDRLLHFYEQLHNDAASPRTAAEKADVAALRVVINQAAPGS